MRTVDFTIKVTSDTIGTIAVMAAFVVGGVTAGLAFGHSMNSGRFTRLVNLLPFVLGALAAVAGGALGYWLMS